MPQHLTMIITAVVLIALIMVPIVIECIQDKRRGATAPPIKVPVGVSTTRWRHDVTVVIERGKRAAVGVRLLCTVIIGGIGRPGCHSAIDR